MIHHNVKNVQFQISNQVTCQLESSLSYVTADFGEVKTHITQPAFNVSLIFKQHLTQMSKQHLN